MQISMLFALALALSTPAADPPSPFAPLAGGRLLGVSAIHVESGRREEYNAGVRFAMASTYKLPIAVAALRAAEQGTVALEAKVTIGKADLRRGMGNPLGAGTYTLRELLVAMLQESDNSATDAVFRVLGGPPAVRTALAALGIQGIDVSRTEGEIFADVSARRARPGDVRDTASPEAMARLLVRLQEGKLLGPDATATLLGWMRGCRTGAARIRAGVPRGTEVANKTGTMEAFAGDVGLVTLPDGTHLALAVYVKGGRDREKAIEKVARTAWGDFARQ